MDDQTSDVGSIRSTPMPGAPVEGWMLREDVVREMLARLERSEQVKAIARDLGIEKDDQALATAGRLAAAAASRRRPHPS